MNILDRHMGRDVMPYQPHEFDRIDASINCWKITTPYVQTFMIDGCPRT
jgi:hypothetical protein